MNNPLEGGDLGTEFPFSDELFPTKLDDKDQDKTEPKSPTATQETSTVQTLIKAQQEDLEIQAWRVHRKSKVVTRNGVLFR